MSVALRDVPSSGSSPVRLRPLVRNVSVGWALGACAFAATFALAYRYGNAFGQATSAPFWFPDSVLICVLLSLRRRWWWLPLLATLPIRLAITFAPEPPLWFLLSAWANDCIKAALVALLLRRFVRDPMRFAGVRDFAVYCLIAVLLIPAASAMAGAASRQVLGFDYWSSLQQWYLGDALAALILTPVLFYWVMGPARDRSLQSSRWPEIILLSAGLYASMELAFESDASQNGFAATGSFIPVVFMMWAAVRFGMAGATGAVALLAILAVASALVGGSPFDADSPAETARQLQEFLLLRSAPLFLVAVVVEQSRRVSANLRESELLFRTMADVAPALMWMTGVDKGCMFVSKAWTEFTGRTFAECLGDGWVTAVHVDDQQRAVATYRSSFDARQDFSMEFRLLHTDGTYRWLLSHGVPRYSSGREFAGYMGACIDITDRHRQEAALRQSEERYREVVDSQTDFVCRFRLDSTLTFVNEAYCRFLRQPREELLGTRLLDRLPESVRESVGTLLERAGETREPCSWDCEVAQPDGSHGWQHWVAFGIFGGDGALLEYQAIGHDVTDRKRAEESDRKLAHAGRLAALGELTALVAHEINQPLCAILNNAEAAEILLKSDNPPLPLLREIAADIRRDDLRADEAIRNIRGLIRKSELRIQPMDLNVTVKSVLRLIGGDALSRRVSVHQELAPGLPQAMGDPAYIEQVLLNLVVNGMDAMADGPEARRHLTVRTGSQDDHLLVSVIDCGQGIAAELAPQLFDSFFSTKTNGMGLGLSIARSIVQAHQGRIWAENSALGGAILHFTLPVVAKYQ